ncbi:MAG TPA: M23 family metallopeptidase [Capsulimonadaceae bacterium]|nr:M23 family metallopeptidase [Capsulimonadaceae bacterium]
MKFSPRPIAMTAAFCKYSLLVLIAMLLPIPSQAQPERGTPVTTPAIVAQVVAAGASGDWSAVMPRMTSGMAALVTPDVTAGIKTGFDQFGAVQSVETWQETAGGGGPSYQFIAHLTQGDIPGSLTLDNTGRIAGLQFQPGEKHAQRANPPTGYVTKGDVHLPFNGAWYALWGGVDPAANQPHVQAGGSQRYAYDVAIVKDGLTHASDGSKNSDYYAYGQPILSPVTGTVVTVIDGIPENKPGAMNTLFLPGNCVVIDDGLGEYFALCHLQPGHMVVKVGDHVALGQQIGLCGNSGNATEPHLHFQMQDSPDLSTAAGLPITFRRFLQDGKAVDSGVAGGKVTLENRGTFGQANASK